MCQEIRRVAGVHRKILKQQRGLGGDGWQLEAIEVASAKLKGKLVGFSVNCGEGRIRIDRRGCQVWRQLQGRRRSGSGKGAKARYKSREGDHSHIRISNKIFKYDLTLTLIIVQLLNTANMIQIKSSIVQFREKKKIGKKKLVGF